MLRPWMSLPFAATSICLVGCIGGGGLLVTEDVCIEPAYYASSGVFFTQSDGIGEKGPFEN